MPLYFKFFIRPWLHRKFEILIILVLKSQVKEKYYISFHFILFIQINYVGKWWLIFSTKEIDGEQKICSGPINLGRKWEQSEKIICQLVTVNLEWTPNTRFASSPRSAEKVQKFLTSEAITLGKCTYRSHMAGPYCTCVPCKIVELPRPGTSQKNLSSRSNWIFSSFTTVRKVKFYSK